MKKQLLFILFFIQTSWLLAQPGAVDPSFGDYMTGFTKTIFSNAIQNDNKVLFGGGFYGGIIRFNADGSVDNTFTRSVGANGAVRAIALQIDGKILISGDFTSYNGITRNGIARINPNGTLDESFNPGAGTNDAIASMISQPDGKIIIGGKFTMYNGLARNRLCRINTDGTIDQSFNIGTGSDGEISILTLQSNGKILVGGNFGSFNGITKKSVLRLNDDGTLDTTFNFGIELKGSSYNTPPHIYVLTIQTDGQIAIGGDFNYQQSGVEKRNILRINSSGLIDNSFNREIGPYGGTGGSVWQISQLKDNKLLVCGGFTYYDKASRKGLARLNLDGSLDNTFDYAKNADGEGIVEFIIQGDNKMILIGGFKQFSGIDKDAFVRLNSDGSLDNTYNIVFTGAKEIEKIIVQPDGKLLIKGNFSFFNGLPRKGFARLNINGSLDESFDAAKNASGYIDKFLVQDDGKIIIAGSFSTYSGVVRNGIARINADGSLDASFDPKGGLGSGYIEVLSLQSDGKILAGGLFDSYDGVSRRGILRINSNGTIDGSFNPGAGVDGDWSTVNSLTIQADGKIILRGQFKRYNYVIKNGIARVNTDGSLDSTFDPGSGQDNGPYYTYPMAVQKDGKIVLGGSFGSFRSTNINGIVRLNSNGTIDQTFKSGLENYSTVFDLYVQDDGKIVIAGYFKTYNGLKRMGLARLNSDGSLDNSFNPAKDENLYKSIQIQKDGNFVLGGSFYSYDKAAKNGILRVFGQGTCPSITFPLSNSYSIIRDTEFSLTINPSGGSLPYTFAASVGILPTGITLSPTGVINGKTLQTGNFNVSITATDANGCAATQSYKFAVTSTAPEINLKQNTTNIPSAGTFAFGNQTANTSSTATIFTIENTGTGSLTLSSSPKIAISGANATEFSINQTATAATIAAGANTTFTVTLSPTSAGSKTAQLSIANNDSDENPYTINLTGTGVALSPEVNIKQGTTNIASAGTFAFGNQTANTSSTTTAFTIENTGAGSLTLSGSPKIAISGSNASEFSINQTATAATVAAGGNTTFTVTFSPISAGSKTAQLSIANNDSDENPYVINLTGTGVALSPEVNIKQGTANIATGGTFAFGSQSTAVPATFTIENLGTGTLNLAGTPIVAVTGTNASEFLVSQTATTATVAPGATTTFTVTFASTSAGSKTAKLSIANNDSDENPYEINLTGTGVSCTNPSNPTITQAANTTFTSSTLTSSAAPTGGSYQWLLGGTAITGATSQTYTTTKEGSYTVRVTVTGGCNATSDPFVLVVTALEDVAGANVSVYPNPVKEQLTISLAGFQGKKDIVVFNATGKQVAGEQVTGEEANINVADYPQGIYFVKIVTSQGVSTIKFLKQ